MSTQTATERHRMPVQLKAGAIRGVWILLALAGMALIYPWRNVQNTEEIAAAQAVVDEMSAAHASITAGSGDIGDYTTANDGFAGFTTSTPAGVAAAALIGESGDNCLVMHWTAADIAQVGRLPPGTECEPAAVTVVPFRPNDGYVPGTGPPFDVTPLIREAHTPFWFVAALVVLMWVTIKAALDLFLIFQRPDYFFSK